MRFCAKYQYSKMFDHLLNKKVYCSKVCDIYTAIIYKFIRLSSIVLKMCKKETTFLSVLVKRNFLQMQPL